MRKFVISFFCLMLCTACSAPSSDSHQVVASPEPTITQVAVQATTVQPTLTQGTQQASPIVIQPTPIRAASSKKDASLLEPAPYTPSRLTYYALPADADQTFHWSSDGQFILYNHLSPTYGYGYRTLSLFNTKTHTSQKLIDDLYHLDDYNQVFPVWDEQNSSILYLQAQSETSASLRAINLKGEEQRIFLADIFVKDGWEIYREDARMRANAAPLSVFDLSIASNGRVGILSNTQITSMRLNEPDQQFPLPTQIQQRLAELQPADYHQLWLAPDGQHYAIAITQTLSLFQVYEEEPRISYDFSSLPVSAHKPVIAIQFYWSPDSQHYIFRPAYTEDVGRYQYQPPYVQTVSDTTAYSPFESFGYPIIPGSWGGITDFAWAPSSDWLVVSTSAGVQCSGTVVGCITTQVLIQPWASQASIIWASPHRMRNPVMWTSDSLYIAHICSPETTDPFKELPFMCILELESEES